MADSIVYWTKLVGASLNQPNRCRNSSMLKTRECNYNHNVFAMQLELKESCRNLSLGLATKARACKGASQEKAWESHLMLLGV